MSVVRRLLVSAYLVEAGLLLIVAPWSASWDHNYFAFRLPALGAVMANAFVRGAVSGVGLVTVFAGLRDLGAALSARRVRPADPTIPPTRGTS